MKRISMLVEGTYASYILSSESAEQLVEWMNNVGIKEQIKSEDLHITTTYSTKDVDIVPADRPINLNHLDYRIGVLGDALVLLVKSNELNKVHNAAIRSGATYDYESYTPHISLSYNTKANKGIIEELIPPSFDIKLTHEEVKKTTEEMTGVGAVATTTLPITKKVLRRSKTLKDLLKESYMMGGYYSIWGWIEPNGKLLLPTMEQRLERGAAYSHKEIFKSKYGKLTQLNESMRLGFVRFAVGTANGPLHLEFDGRTPKIRTTITKGMGNIDSLLNNVTQLKKIYGDVKNDDYGYLAVSYTDIDTVQGRVVIAGGGLRQLYNYLSSIDDIEGGQHNKSKTLKDLIKEGFVMSKYYGAWGWITPDGELLLPTQEQRLDVRVPITHRELFRSEYGGIKPQKDAHRLGFVKFAVESGRKNLYLEFDSRSPKIRTTITKGIQNIDSLLENLPKLKKIYGDVKKDDYVYLTVSYSDYIKSGVGLRQLYSYLSSLDVIESSQHNKSKTTPVTNEDYVLIKNKKKAGSSWKSIIEEFNINFNGAGPLKVQNSKGEFTFIKYGNYRF